MSLKRGPMERDSLTSQMANMIRNGEWEDQKIAGLGLARDGKPTELGERVKRLLGQQPPTYYKIGRCTKCLDLYHHSLLCWGVAAPGELRAPCIYCVIKEEA